MHTLTEEIPKHYHQFQPAVPYPGWYGVICGAMHLQYIHKIRDRNWDRCDLNEAEIAKKLGHVSNTPNLVVP